MMMTSLNSILSSDQIGFFDIFYQDNLGTETWISAGSLDYRLGKG